MWGSSFAITCLSCFIASVSVYGVQWIVPEWNANEPQYPPGSLFWMTNEYRRCPVLYRTVLAIKDKPIGVAGFSAQAEQFAYAFLNGNEVASAAPEESQRTLHLATEFSHLLRPGSNALVISTSADGFSLKGFIKYKDGEVQSFGSDISSWKVQKFPPLTMIDYEPCMKPDFDDKQWFGVKIADKKPLEISNEELDQKLVQIVQARLDSMNESAQWRIKMLAEKGISIVDWVSHGWGGAGRLPEWVRMRARASLKEESLSKYEVAEALTRYLYLADEMTNMENHIVGLKALKAEETQIETCQKVANTIRQIVGSMEDDIKSGNYSQAIDNAVKGELALSLFRSVRPVNELGWCLDNKFGWIDTTVFLDNNISDWGLRIESEAEVFPSPLSPAAYVKLLEDKFAIGGWANIEPLRVYNKPEITGPICLWAVLDGKVTNLLPNAEGIVYDRTVNGELSENWVLIVSDLSAGGHLPIQLVFLQKPKSIVFELSEKGAKKVIVIFERASSNLFILRPLKEWRGLLQQARTMKGDPLNEAEASQYIRQCRFWSKALLNYPVTFSEIFTRDREDSILCVDVYNYWKFQDEWNTEAISIAPLPPLATYGLMMNYPGLSVVSEAKTVGSRGIWGDEVVCLNQNYIIYRVPLDPIKRFGGFTSYCFGPTDIGEPGSITEIETIKHTGSNTFRPQHNQTGERAMKTLQWCWERGLQNVFNTDEKWVPDVCEHFRQLAKQCKDYPPDAVAYDLLNEPETRDPSAYDALIRKITSAIREVDKTHLIYVEAFPPWGPGAKPFPKAAFENLRPTGDKLTCYSFHDYEFRLPPKWPNEDHDIRDILRRWIPAFKFSIDSQRPIHLGEFGGFEQTDQSVYDNPCAYTLMMDYFRIFDQFGWHWHYYSNRGTVRVRKDGSLQDSYVQKAHRDYFAKGTFNINKKTLF